MIPEKTIQEILDATKIEDVIGDFVTLRRRGANYVACCPFHEEKTPSFSVSPSKGIFKCFGCGQAGNAVHFIMKHENLSYVDALKYLARKYHIIVEETVLTEEEKAKRQHSDALYLTMEFAQNWFVDNLRTPEGSALALAYYHSRGLTDETIKNFGLGWGMSSYTAFSTAALAAGYKEEYLLETGMCYKKDNGSLGDHFAERVTFPIHSISGRIIAFSCRTLRTDKNVAKYKNSPETEIYLKHKNLFGIFQAKGAIAKEDRAILVEGNLDVVQMHQSGICNVVASLGTSLTPDQIKVIRKLTNNVTIMYDGDAAGIKATLRAIQLVLPEGMDLNIVSLPAGQDPDDFAKTHSKDEIQEYIASNEKDFVQYMYDHFATDEVLSDPAAMGNIINNIADTIALIPDGIKRATYVEKVAKLFNIDVKLVSTRVKRTKTGNATRENVTKGGNATPAYTPKTTYSKEQKILTAINNCEKEIIEYLLKHGCTELLFPNTSPDYSHDEKRTVADFIDEKLRRISVQLSNPVYKKIYDRYFDLYEDGFECEQIQEKLINSLDQDVVEICTNLLFSDVELTSKAFINSLPATNHTLTQKLPTLMKLYEVRLYEKIINEVTTQIKENPNDMDLFKKLQILNKKKVKISKEIGRI